MTKEELLKAKQNLEILKLSGYPSIDKPWVVNYNQKELGKEIPNGKSLTVGDIYNWEEENGGINKISIAKIYQWLGWGEISHY